MAESEDYRLAKVQGRVRAKGALLQSPLSNAQCIGYRVEITELWRGRGWNVRNEFSEETASDFLLDDGTACALVFTEGARLLLDLLPIDDDSDHRQAVDRLLARAGIKRDFDESVRYLCRESVLLDGQHVVIRARARWMESAGDFRQPPTRSLELRGTPEFPVLVGDPRDVDGPG